MNLALLAILGYAIGGIPTGIWLCRMVKGQDPRDSGSGTSGATNVSRVLGKKWAVVVLIVDALKGFLPVRFIVPNVVEPSQVALAGSIMMICLVAGHVWTPYAGFRGGKGVATATGAMIALNGLAVATGLGVWVIAFLIARIVSLASLVAVVSLPIILSLLPQHSHIIINAAIALMIIIIFTHRANIERLKRGEEKKLF
jgi:acyl phosphate:glycerol-3-phosphate acyltransferase